jgi:hypothetical protein
MLWLWASKEIDTLSKATYCKAFASRKCDCEIPVPGLVNVFTSQVMPFRDRILLVKRFHHPGVKPLWARYEFSKVFTGSRRGKFVPMTSSQPPS